MKFSPVFPRQALQWSLSTAGLELDQIDAFGYFMSTANIVRGPDRPRADRLTHYPDAYHVVPSNVLPFLSDRYDEHVEQRFVGHGHDRRFYYVDHHTAHASHAFFASPFEEAAILTLDGRGDGVCGSIGIGRGDRVELLLRSPFPHSIGQLYATFTELIGFRPNRDEYKLMGLAAFGDPARYYEDVRRMVQLLPNGALELDLSYFSFHYPSAEKFTPKLSKLVGGPRQKDEPFVGRLADIAAACQRVTEEMVLHVARAAQRLTGARSLCYAGGVALNSVANGLLLRETGFERMYIPADPSDAGSAFGVASYLSTHVMGQERPEPLLHDQHGPSFDGAEIEAQLGGSGLPLRRVGDPAAAAAELIANGSVVGWFQGRMEFGPRALGNRSILADPRRPEMKEIVNEKVKFREAYRPFAPSVQAESVHRVFESAEAMSSLGAPTDFMICVLPVRQDWRGRIPAVTHEDGTGRVQTVRRETNEPYWRLIGEFERRTGVPVVLNTSFNVMDEPIVLSPADALRCFLASGLDHLVCGHIVVDKRR